jgi:hypothetical protein
MLKSGKSKSQELKFACSCCNSKRIRRKGKHAARQAEKRDFRKEVW